MEQLGPTGWDLMKFDVEFFYSKVCRESPKFHWNPIRITRALHEDVFTFMTIICRMRNISNKFVGKIKTRILCAVTFFRKSCLLCENVDTCGGAREENRNDNTIWRMRVASWTSKATQAHARTEICNTDCFSTAAGFVNPPQCYVIRTLRVLSDLAS